MLDPFFQDLFLIPRKNIRLDTHSYFIVKLMSDWLS